MKTDEQGLRVRPTRPWLGPDRPLLQRLARPVVDFLQIEAAGGVFLLVADLIALAWANSPWSSSYESGCWSSASCRWRLGTEVQAGVARGPAQAHVQARVAWSKSMARWRAAS